MNALLNTGLRRKESESTTLVSNSVPELLPLDAHVLSTSPIGLVESPPQARIPPAHYWWRRNQADKTTRATYRPLVRG